MAIARWDIHFIRIRITNFLLRRGNKARRCVALRERPIYVNLGAGPRGLNDTHWVNVDGYADVNVHFLLDFNRRLPFAAESIDGVFCEHVLEHFSLDDAEKLVTELRRCLRKGGVGRFIVPDAAHILRTYITAPAKLIEVRGQGCGTAMEAVNSYFRQRYEHQFLFDWETMKLMLERAGFSKVLQASFGNSQLCASLVLDDPKYKWESLYVEVMK